MFSYTQTRIRRIFDLFPKRNAFCINDHYYTYSQFCKHVAGIQNLLQNTPSKNNIVAILTDDSIESYASIFAVWLMAKTFVPLNAKNPPDRNLEIISESNCGLILSACEEYTNSIKTSCRILLTREVIAEEPVSFHDLKEDDLAYILFTSGSTGKPKGVQISWKNLDAFCDSYFSIGFKIDENDRFLQMFDLSFDGSIMSFLPAVCLGACSYTIPANNIKFTQVLTILEEKEITIGLIVPSVISFLKPYFNEIRLDKLNYCIVGAEASYTSIISQWEKCIPNAEIYNFYGPTETTVFCLYYKFNSAINHTKSYNDVLSLGRPVKNMEVSIINPDNEFLPVGVKGEIVITGSQLTKGYINNPSQNNHLFLDLFSDGKLKRFYKTGDEGFYDEDGDFFYCGRIDHQVQLQGFRVELNEIELPVRREYHLINVVAVDKKDENGITKIYLFTEKFGGDLNHIRKYLKNKLPPYMLPSKIINLDEIPLNANGKIDRNFLRSLI